MQNIEQEILINAIEDWKRAATYSGPEAYVASCLRTVTALEMELATGKPHCNCHLLPNCPSKIDTHRSSYR